ncbi:MAG TPA: hypothetical protein VFR40_11295 [Lapillicoccus sp.]|nr:hypothetical protein [Lapillicoccus sp.]
MSSWRDRLPPAVRPATVDRLSSIDRSLVEEAVREIASIQRRMTNVAHVVPAHRWVSTERQ